MPYNFSFDKNIPPRSKKWLQDKMRNDNPFNAVWSIAADVLSTPI